MIGIHSIGTYVPQELENNFQKIEKFSVDKKFITEKIGFKNLAKKQQNETSSDLATQAFHNLCKHNEINREKIDFIAVCTQNGDNQIPHTSSILQHKLALPKSCAAFDISLSCSGYVYGLQIAKSFMEANDLKNGLLFTADPYSNITSDNDKNTNLLFGDAATVTLLNNEAAYDMKRTVYLTSGEKHSALIKEKNAPLKMNGRVILDFCIKNVETSIKNCIEKNEITPDSIDLILLHQASKYIIDLISSKLINAFPCFENKIPFRAENIGNTISSTIPLLLKNFLNSNNKNILLSGFGAGLSIATTLIQKRSTQHEE
ncbi:MAG: ketoacyl-ACP synthase III [Gammaproteobacteria bacterium]